MKPDQTRSLKRKSYFYISAALSKKAMTSDLSFNCFQLKLSQNSAYIFIHVKIIKYSTYDGAQSCSVYLHLNGGSLYKLATIAGYEP